MRDVWGAYNAPYTPWSGREGVLSHNPRCFGDLIPSASTHCPGIIISRCLCL